MERGRYAAMRYGLDSINQLNRNSQLFTPADVQPYLDYFSRHGNSNDQMLAYYLLGRAYHERGEAPMALQYYQEAAGKVDTTSTDCDYAQLSRVYSQMADIFYNQNLLRQELTYDKLAERYAWKGKDTLAALMNIEQASMAYERMNKPDSAIFVMEDVAHQYEQYGYPVDAAIALGTIVDILLKRGEYSKAKRYLTQYEAKSGFFDSFGNISSGREIYYRLKGLYFLYTNALDSAEFYFRKELTDGKDFNNQNAGAYGLGMVYERLHQPDSAANYYRYAYAMNDSMYAQMATEDIERMQAMYDYTRHQEMAKKEREKAVLEKNKMLLTLFLLIFTLLIAGTIVYKMYSENRKKQAIYIQNLRQLEQIQSEVFLLREHADEYEKLIAEKEKLFIEQNAKMLEQRKKVLNDHFIIDKSVRESEIYKQLQKKQYGCNLTIDELRESRKLVIENFPEFNNLLFSKQYKLSEKDFNVCVLFRLGFKSKEISNMLNVTQGRISQICSKVLREVFGKDKGGAAELIEKLHDLY